MKQNNKKSKVILIDVGNVSDGANKSGLRVYFKYALFSYIRIFK